MQTISISDFRKLLVREIKEMMPLVITSDGEELGTLALSKDIILLDGIAPAMQFKLKSIEELARPR